MNEKIMISTHTPLARRDVIAADFHVRFSLISTHTPLARRDLFAGYTRPTGAISTHTPLARRDFWD